MAKAFEVFEFGSEWGVMLADFDHGPHEIADAVFFATEAEAHNFAQLRREAEAKFKHADALEAYGRYLELKREHAVTDRDLWRAACELVEPLLREHPDWKWKDAVAELRRQGLVPEPQPSRASQYS